MPWLTCWSGLLFLFVPISKTKCAYRRSLCQKLSGLNLSSKTSCRQNSVMRLTVSLNAPSEQSDLKWSSHTKCEIFQSQPSTFLGSLAFFKFSNHALPMLWSSTDFFGSRKWKKVFFPSPWILQHPHALHCSIFAEGNGCLSTGGVLTSHGLRISSATDARASSCRRPDSGKIGQINLISLQTEGQRYP